MSAAVELVRIPAPPSWWTVAWATLLPGDLVRAPDGSAWRVECSIACGDSGEWLLRSPAGAAWSTHQLGDQVEAWRPPASATSAQETDQAVNRLRMFGFDVDLIKE